MGGWVPPVTPTIQMCVECPNEEWKVGHGLHLVREVYVTGRPRAQGWTRELWCAGGLQVFCY